MGPLRLFLRYAVASARAQMQYPASTAMLTVGHLLVTGIEFLAAWSLFRRFGGAGGWGLGEVAVLYGLAHIAFSLAETLTRGFHTFGTEVVRTGDFDRLLLRPRSLVLQLLGYEVRLSRLGRAVQGLAALALAPYLADFAWTPAGVSIAVWAVFGGAALFAGLFVLQATLSFWTVETLEVGNVLTYGGVQAAQFPLDFYAAWFRRFLLVLVPLGCVVYLPALAILGRADPFGAPAWFLPLAPIAGFAFLAGSLFAWRFGVARYTSTGS